MVQLNILSGKMAGDVKIVRRFPFCIGRASGNHLCLDDAGVWDSHLTLGFQKKEGFILDTAGEAWATVNGESKKSTRLSNGDTISFGSAKIQFWLAPPKLRGLRLREAFVWALLAAVTAIQLSLIYWLVR
ncbi:MAG TPA: FHA domain-containing protein [Verrucomicrobiae bacterium]|jgi:pSer/pThr/pTyr-binding forkhead associated (FHA) protein